MCEHQVHEYRQRWVLEPFGIQRSDNEEELSRNISESEKNGSVWRLGTKRRKSSREETEQLVSKVTDRLQKKKAEIWLAELETWFLQEFLTE